MKKSIKDLLPAFILAFVTSFMLFIFEPIILYASNIDDFWFDLSQMVGPLLIMFTLAFLGLSILSIVLYIINKFLIKKIKIYNICLIAGYIIFLIFYVHGNFMAGWLPSLDGTKINWYQNTLSIGISSSVSIGIIILYLILVFKLKSNTVVKYSNYLVCAIFAMLSVSLITTILTTENININKVIGSSTYESLNKYSTDKNFIIFILDAVDSVRLVKEMNKYDEFENLFEDFTYYPDTISAYPFTRDSIPFIISGMWNENKTDFISYATEAYNESPLLKKLRKDSYDLNYYDYEIYYNDKKITEFLNYKLCDINFLNFFKLTLKYDAYKYFPYLLKKYSKVESLDFSFAKKISSDDENFLWTNDSFVNFITSNDAKLTTNKQFKFIHLEGGHVPHNLDKDLNTLEIGNYEQKLDSSLTTVKYYLEKLKENGIYDNSAIMIMADHGYSDDGVDGRQNPMLFIKGVNEKHEMINSDLPISYADLNDVYYDLLDSKKSTELFSNVTKKRTRRYIWYQYLLEDHMIEYELNGKAWDTSKLTKTGKEFNR